MKRGNPWTVARDLGLDDQPSRRLQVVIPESMYLEICSRTDNVSAFVRELLSRHIRDDR